MSKSRHLETIAVNPATTMIELMGLLDPGGPDVNTQLIVIIPLKN